MRRLVETKLRDLYGENVPVPIRERVEFELRQMERFGLEQDFVLLSRMVKSFKSRQVPFFLGGEASSCFLLYVIGATMVNPLAPHYYHPIEKRVEFSDAAADGFDLPEREEPWIADGHDLAPEMFWGPEQESKRGMYPNISLRLPERAYKSLRRRMMTDAKYEGFPKQDMMGGRSFRCGSLFLTGNMALPQKEVTWYQPMKAKDIRHYELERFRYILNLEPGTDAIPTTFLGVLRIFGLTRGSWAHVRNQRSAPYGGWSEETMYSLEDFGYSLDVVPAFYDDVYDMVVSEGYSKSDAYYEAKRVSLGRGLSEEVKERLYDRPQIPWCISALRLYSKAHALDFLLMDYRLQREKFRRMEMEAARVREAEEAAKSVENPEVTEAMGVDETPEVTPIEEMADEARNESKEDEVLPAGSPATE